MELVFMVVTDQDCPSETAKKGIKVRDEVISLLWRDDRLEEGDHYNSRFFYEENDYILNERWTES